MSDKLSTPDVHRLLAAINHQPYDRVPSWEIIIDDRSTRYLLGWPPREDGQPLVTLWSIDPADAVRLAQRVCLDAIPCSLSWMAAEPGTIRTMADLEKVEPPDPQLARPRLQSYLDAVRGTDIGVIARLSGPLTLSYMAAGPVPIESFMYLLYDDPALVARLMDMHLDYHLRLIDAIADLPYHLYYIGDDVSSTTGPIISPRHIEELWAPRTERLVRAARGTGRPVIFHCCGQQAPILPYLADWGVEAVHPIQPVANDIYAMKAEWGDRLTLVGNIDVAGCLSHGTPEQVRQSVRQHLERLGRDGGYVVCSSHSIIDSVPPENYLALCQATVEFGRPEPV